MFMCIVPVVCLPVRKGTFQCSDFDSLRKLRDRMFTKRNVYMLSSDRPSRTMRSVKDRREIAALFPRLNCPAETV